MTTGVLALAAGGLLAGSVVASLVAARLRIPALLLFLAIGMVAGSDGAGWIAFDHYRLAREAGTVALAAILFDGGLRSGLSELKSVVGPALRLAVGGTVIVAVVTGLAAMALFQLPPLDGLLLGAIVASTDSAAVFGLLGGSTLRLRLKRTLEGEAGFNDPVALVLVVGVMECIRNPNVGFAQLAWNTVLEFVVGAGCGAVVAVLGAATLSWIRLPRPGLYPVATVAVAGIAYGAADTLHGSGFLAVYLAGLIIGDVPSAGKHASAVFHDSVAWVAQIGVFVMFGLLAFPSRLGAVAPQAIVIALVLVFVARPLATVVATAGQHFSLAERAVLSWAGLRGAAPMVFATYPVAAHMRGSTDLFDTVFFVVVISTLLQGATFEPLAHRLGLTSVATVQADAEGLAAAKSVEYAVTGMDGVVGRRVRDLVLVPGSTLVSIVRADAVLPLAMATRLMAGDTLHFLVHEEIAGRVDDLLACLRDPVLRQRPIGY